MVEKSKSELESEFQEKALQMVISSLENFVQTKKWMKNKKNLDFLNLQEWSIFIKSMFYITPSSYGAKISKRLIKELNGQEINPTEEKGDFIDCLGAHCEMKVSLSLDDKPKINLVQIRPWQNTDYYFASFILKNNIIYAYCFKLSSEQMKEELKKSKFSFAHGTKKALAQNKTGNHELRITINVNENDETFKRWFLNYRTDFFDKYDDIITPKNLEEIKLINKA